MEEKIGDTENIPDDAESVNAEAFETAKLSMVMARLSAKISAVADGGDISGTHCAPWGIKMKT